MAKTPATPPTAVPSAIWVDCFYVGWILPQSCAVFNMFRSKNSMLNFCCSLHDRLPWYASSWELQYNFLRVWASMLSQYVLRSICISNSPIMHWSFAQSKQLLKEVDDSAYASKFHFWVTCMLSCSSRSCLPKFCRRRLADDQRNFSTNECD